MDCGALVMITGGARSGKSSLAEKIAAASKHKVIYIATAAADDTEMAARIELHRRRRPASWQTVEAPLEIAAAIERAGGSAETTVLVDSLGMWISNLMLQAAAGENDLREKQALIMDTIMNRVRETGDIARQVPARVIIVTEEAGMGLVPPYPRGRFFRDLLGLANQEIARRADYVYLVVAGLPVVLKDVTRGINPAAGCIPYIALPED